MRFVHTADWHLGKTLARRSLLDSQVEVLAELRRLVFDAKADALLVAGDIYDQRTPPADAVALLDETLTKIALELGTRIVLIGGNHDSAERVGFGARLLEGRGIHIAGPVDTSRTLVRFDDAHGAVYVATIPYADPSFVRAAYQDDSIVDHDTAMARELAAARAKVPPRARSIAVAHALVAGGDGSDSERVLSVGGTGAVVPERFDGFDYVALGHLHRPQRAGREEVRYSGSLLKYSFSEAAHDKGVSVVELDAKGACRVEHVPLRPRRDVRVIRGTLQGLIEGAKEDRGREDYLAAVLEDRGALLDPMGKLRQVYPNLLTLERAELRTVVDAERAARQRSDKARPLLEDFADFYREVTGGEATSLELDAAREVIADAEVAEERGG